MKKTTWTFGLIAGVINALWMISFVALGQDKIDFDKGEIIGYAAMIISFSMIFVGIKTYRDKYNEGFIPFGQAFKLGIFISLIASAMYVLVWLFEYYIFMPDFGDKYAQHMIDKMRSNGAPEAEIQKQITEMQGFKEMYQNPFFNIVITFTEIFPVGLIITLISAAILKRAPRPSAMA